MEPRTKKILRNVLFLLAIPLLVGAFVFANNISNKLVCNGLKVDLTNPEIGFITNDDIENIIKEEGIVPNRTFIKQIDVKKIEQKLLQNKWIEKVTVFTSANGILQSSILQKEPVIRLQHKDSNSYAYYLDCHANPIEWSEKYTPRLLVATTPRLAYTKNDLRLKSSLVHLAQVIEKDTFWNAFVTQVDVDSKGELNLIPVLGNHLIKLGNDDYLEDKLARVFVFYQQGMHSVDWNKFDEIDARFLGQIVCRNSFGEVLSEDPYGSKEQAIMKKEEALEKSGKKLDAKSTTKSPAVAAIATHKKAVTVKAVTNTKPKVVNIQKNQQLKTVAKTTTAIIQAKPKEKIKSNPANKENLKPKVEIKKPKSKAENKEKPKLKPAELKTKQ